MDALLHSNRVPEPHEAKIISSMMNSERDSINALETRIHQLEQDAEMARQRIQKLTTQLEAETRGLRFYEDAIVELKTTRNVLGQSIERKQAMMSSRRRIPGDIWRKIFLLLWENELEPLGAYKRTFSVALQVGAVCREWRDLAKTTTRLWSILEYTFSSNGRVKFRREKEMYHYLDHIGGAAPYLILHNAPSLDLPSALHRATTAIELAILLELPRLGFGPSLTFPLSTPVFSQLCTLSINSPQFIHIMSDSLRPFPSLDRLHLMNTRIHWLQPIIPHNNLKNHFIEGTWEVPNHWLSATIDIAMIAKWFPNLTVLTLDCDWQYAQQISLPQVVFHHLKYLCIRSSAISDIHELTFCFSFPSLDKITNRGKSMNGLAPIVQAWGERVETLVLSGLEPYDGFGQHLSEILGDSGFDSGKLPRLSELAFQNITQTRAIDLALVVDAVIKHNDSAANDQEKLNRIKTVTLPSFYKSDPNLDRWHVSVKWE